MIRVMSWFVFGRGCKLRIVYGSHRHSNLHPLLLRGVLVYLFALEHLSHYLFTTYSSQQ
jgi:hypothetical protein